jgi:vancomycin resistance protein YoaR
MGISTTLAVYSTYYAGSANRIHNLQLAISLLDGRLVPPGGTFSLNDTVGERTAERGFRVAPVIVGSEYEEAVGGGTSQVATTIFNAAWEAGLKIAERNPHALYISRYPLGRDATVNYPNLDLKFVNDTKRWILVRGWSTASGISVGLYGAPTGRRVVSAAGPLVVRGPIPIERTADPELPRGEQVIEEYGAPPQSVVVTRKVYLPSGKLLYDETWSTYYRGEKRVVRVGTKAPEPPPPPETTTTTTTTTTETQPPPGQ